jgi:Uncharacterized protein conserved in bacteria
MMKQGAFFSPKKCAKRAYTILVPQMLPVMFKLVLKIFNRQGYHVEALETTGRKVVETGLKYVHNDMCYPAILTIGQLIEAVESGRYDVHKIALAISQTGGGCRASNYVHMLRKALKRANLEFVPVVSININGLEPNPGFKLTLNFGRELILR